MAAAVAVLALGPVATHQPRQPLHQALGLAPRWRRVALQHQMPSVEMQAQKPMGLVAAQVHKKNNSRQRLKAKCPSSAKRKRKRVVADVFLIGCVTLVRASRVRDVEFCPDG